MTGILLLLVVVVLLYHFVTLQAQLKLKHTWNYHCLALCSSEWKPLEKTMATTLKVRTTCSTASWCLQVNSGRWGIKSRTFWLVIKTPSPLDYQKPESGWPVGPSGTDRQRDHLPKEINHWSSSWVYSHNASVLASDWTHRSQKPTADICMLRSLSSALIKQNSQVWR